MTPDDFDLWCGTFAHACDVAPDTAVAIFGVDDGDEATICGVDPDEQAALVAYADQLLASPRQVAAMASRVAWSPTPTGQSSPAWSLVVVALPDLSFFGVRRIAEDDEWIRLRATDVPWFMLSTAGGLRSALATGASLTVKTLEDDDLLQTPLEQPDPPVDPQGRI